MNKQTTRKVTIPADIMAELDTMRNKIGYRQFTPEQTAILVAAFDDPTMRKDAFHAWWQKKYGAIGYSTLVRRYQAVKNDR